MQPEELIQEQKRLGTDVEKIISNFKKDSRSRKSSAYYHQRIIQLKNLRQQFQLNHDGIALAEDSKEHDYITSNYFDKVMELINKYLSQFISEEGLLQNEEASALPKQQFTNLLPDAQPADELKQLVRQQRALGRALHRNIQTVQLELSIAQSESYYQLKINTIEGYLHQLKANNEIIWQGVNGEDIDGYNIDDYYNWEMETQSILATLYQRLQAVEASSRQNSTQSSAPQMRLPEVTLPTFNGDPLQWVTFKDLYVQLIHSRSFSKVQKMFYLTTNLSGEPLNLIKHLSVTTENYEAAWELLINRYDNKRLLVTSLLTKLLSQPTIKQPTSSSLKSLHDITKECMHGLKAQNLPTMHWDVIMVHLTLRKLDFTTLTAFEQTLDDSRRLLTLDEVLQFLEHRFLSMETLTKGPGHSPPRTCAPCVTQSPEGRCKICKEGTHHIYACKTFLDNKIANRWQLVKRYNLCVNCLKPGHQGNACTARHCTKCTKKHNTLLHGESNTSANNAPKGQGIKEGINPVSLITKETISKNNYVILGTACIKIASADGSFIECRAILDPGSQVNLITDELAKKLGIRIRSSPIKVEGVGRQQSITKYRGFIHIKSRINNFDAKLEVHILPNIVCNQPSQYLDVSEWNIPQNIPLADPDFNKPGSIDCLLGAEIFFHLLTVGQLQLMNDNPILQNTVLGWIVSGKVDNAHITSATCGVLTNNELDDMLCRFWKLEEVDDSEVSLTPDQKLSESHFCQHVKHAANGRLIVRLPFKENLSLLGESKYMAYNRFISLEKRLAKSPGIKEQYKDFMQEYIDLNHMTVVNPDDIMTPHYFIPHHHVLKPDSSTTKLRVVFDASARTSSGSSLNDLMHTGRVVQSELFSILLRFRLPRYVVKTDIEKMYRQILVHNDDRQLQLIIWRNSPSEAIRYYQLNTVTYGTRSAPFLATRCLLKLAEENTTQFPLGAKALKHDFYVDDGLTGSDSLQETIEIKNQLIKILGSARMNLRKWSSNHPKIMDGIPMKDQEISLDLDNDGIKTMGLMWIPKSDEFCIKARIDTKRNITKRTVLSDLAHIFDPLGLVSPIVVTAKIFIQQLWQRQLQWDEQIPNDLKPRWMSFREELANLDNMKLPRHIFDHQATTNVQLHAFADASETAYGAAIYIRAIKTDKSIMVRLLCAKSRVAPLKMQTIPRLELCAALLAAELMARVKDDLGYHDKSIYYWTDSQIVLSWLNQCSSIFQTFVAHRVAKIQGLSVIDQWRHVPTDHNPADVLSRGLSPRKLPTCNIWFYGPLFLYHNEDHWPAPFKRELNIIDSSEHKKSRPVVASAIKNTSFIYSINSRNNFQILQRIVCFMQRFINNCKKKNIMAELTRDVNPMELNAALNTIIKEIQQLDFQDVIRILKENRNLPTSHPLCSLAPFLDDNGILRVGGRTQSSSLPFDAKHPMLLPYNDPIVKLIMEDTHKRHLHCGPQALLAQTRQRFWPIKGKIMARSIVNHCVRCTRAKPALFNQFMGQLPAARVEPSRPFLNAGVDYCGPFWVHFKIRGKRPQKAYIAVFCCFATKAVHLELVTDLTTDAFLGAVKRFISRRGTCKTLFCDNATNFLGAKNQLTELSNAIFSDEARTSIIKSCATDAIEFKFIPPRAPHFGGLWEAAVKSAKHLLIRSTATASLTYEELETVVIEVEAILNSRPLTPMSSDPNDLTALTPGHFIIGEPITSPVDSMAKPIQQSLRDRWKLVSQLKHHFWDRWSKEYLSELQVRHRWKGPIVNIKPNTMVIIKEDNTPVLQWPLGRIVKVYRGEDGAVRVADIKTANGTFKRPIHRLAPLFPEEDNTDSNEIAQLEDERITNERDSQPPRKRRLLNGFNCLIFLALLLPLASAKSATFTPINSNPGLHFENIGIVRRVISNWQLVIYFDLQPFYDESKFLHNGTITLQELCERSIHTSACGPLINHFKNIEAQVESGFNLLPHRRKRGAFNLVGNVANSLFGVLDSSYADQMSATIKAVKANEQHLDKMLKNQTSLIDATLNIIKHNQINTRVKFKELSNELNKIADVSNDDNILIIGVQLLAISSNVQRMHTSLVNLLVDTHHGRINPSLLTPQQLTTETQRIRANLPPGVSLPVSLHNIGDLYSLIHTNAIISDEHVVCTISIPLVDPQDFDLFYLTPVPQPINNTLVIIKSTTKLLALNEHRDELFPITETNFKQCTSLAARTFLCPNIMAIYQTSADICKCEMHLFNNESYSHCEWERSPDKSLWLQLHHQNHWIVAVREPFKISTVCGHKTNQLKLTRTGLLRIDPECSVKTDFINIQGHQNVYTGIESSYTSIGMPVAEINNHLQNGLNNHPFVAQLKEVTQLQEQLHSARLFDLPEEVQTTRHHSLICAYAALILIVAIMIYLITTKYLDGHSTERAPPPQPFPKRRLSWRVATT